MRMAAVAPALGDFLGVVSRTAAPGTFVSSDAGWADTTMLAADAPHPNCAYMWM